MDRNGDQVILTDSEQLNFGKDPRDGTDLIYPGPTGVARTLRISQHVLETASQEGTLRVQGTLAMGKERTVFVSGNIEKLDKFLEQKLAPLQP